MSIVTVKAAVIAKMRTIENIGMVEGRQGRTVQLPWEDATSDAVRPLWVVSLSRSGLAAGDIAKSIGAKCHEHLFQIRGYLPHNFDANTEGTFEAYLDAIRAAFKANPALDVCAQTFPPTIIENIFVQYGAEGGAVLCHYVLIELRTQEWVAD